MPVLNGPHADLAFDLAVELMEHGLFPGQTCPGDPWKLFDIFFDYFHENFFTDSPENKQLGEFVASTESDILVVFQSTPISFIRRTLELPADGIDYDLDDDDPSEEPPQNRPIYPSCHWSSEDQPEWITYEPSVRFRDCSYRISTPHGSDMPAPTKPIKAIEGLNAAQVKQTVLTRWFDMDTSIQLVQRYVPAIAGRLESIWNFRQALFCGREHRIVQNQAGDNPDTDEDSTLTAGSPICVDHVLSLPVRPIMACPWPLKGDRPVKPKLILSPGKDQQRLEWFSFVCPWNDCYRWTVGHLVAVMAWIAYKQILEAYSCLPTTRPAYPGGDGKSVPLSDTDTALKKQVLDVLSALDRLTVISRALPSFSALLDAYWQPEIWRGVGNCPDCRPGLKHISDDAHIEIAFGSSDWVTLHNLVEALRPSVLGSNTLKPPPVELPVPWTN